MEHTIFDNYVSRILISFKAIIVATSENALIDITASHIVRNTFYDIVILRSEYKKEPWLGWSVLFFYKFHSLRKMFIRTSWRPFS